MVGKQVQIGLDVYQTQMAAKVAVKATLERLKKKYRLEYGGKEKVKLYAGDDYDWLDTLFRCHPTAEEMLASDEILFFSVELNTMNKGCIHLEVQFGDGRQTSFSWNSCITQRVRSQKQRVIEAMRTAVEHQTISFKKGKRCCRCGNSSQLETDHCGDHEFRHLVSDFLSIDGGEDIDRLKVKTSDMLSYFEDTDSRTRLFKLRWRAYHKKHAELQVLCSGCHKKKTYGN